MKALENEMENKSINSMRNTFREYSALSVFICLIWSIILAGKQIWPLGEMTLDIGDMAEQCVPAYTFLWDVFHGQKSFWYDWQSGLGNNMAGVALHFGLVSPFNVFFFYLSAELL